MVLRLQARGLDRSWNRALRFVELRGDQLSAAHAINDAVSRAVIHDLNSLDLRACPALDLIGAPYRLDAVRRPLDVYS